MGIFLIGIISNWENFEKAIILYGDNFELGKFRIGNFELGISNWENFELGRIEIIKQIFNKWILYF